jgi:hypothetical protein
MAWFKWSVIGRILALALALVIVSFLVFPLNQVAEANVFSELVARIQILVNPPRGTAPKGRRVGGAGRGPVCAVADNEQRNQSVKALMLAQPVTDPVQEQEQQATEVNSEDANSDTEFVGGFTTEAQPTFWFYVPYTLDPDTSSKRVAQFVLLDDSDRPLWNELMNVELQEHPRLVEYLLPYTLETGRVYNWYFSVICDSDKLSRNPTVRGWVQRVESTPELELALKGAPRFQQYEAYADHGIWFDTLDSLINTRRQFPFVNRDIWTSLLTYFEIPNANQLDVLEPAVPVERELVNGNQLPARMYGDQ